MRGARVWLFLLCTSLAASAVVGSRAQNASSSSIVVLGGAGLPAIDEGAINSESRTFRSFETIHRAAVASGLSRARAGAGGRFLPGHVIVKFRDSASSVDRLSAVKAAAQTGTIAERPSYSDFDIV